jgi:cobalt-precorrin-5B (C1)-methyltransferase
MSSDQPAQMPTKQPARKPDTPLRRGWTTGACAAAASAAALRAILSGQHSDSVTIRLPKGEKPTFKIHCSEKTPKGWRTSIIKDAGDDPDVTHGAEIIVEVRPLSHGAGHVFKAGVGVGTVTLPGLPLNVGEPAINPGPRGMISDALDAVAEEFDAASDAEITVSIPNGEALAEKTMNGRLGIKGGLSVLGTTGIVIPYSCASWINSIHRGVDVARNLNIHHLVATTGSTSEAAAMRAFPDLPEQAFIDMGDFVGGLLKYLRRHPVPLLTIAGGMAKLTKLAQGHLDLHSKRSRVDFGQLAKSARARGASSDIQAAIASANTAMEAFGICKESNVDLAYGIAREARETAMASVAGEIEITIILYDRAGVQIATSQPDETPDA